MPMPVFAHLDDEQPLNRKVKRLLNTDSGLLTMVVKIARALKSSRKAVVVSATIYGTSLIIRIHEADQVAPWRNIGDQPTSFTSVFWYTLHESEEYLVTINDPASTHTSVGRMVQTCTMLECTELMTIEA